jgi:hypothetical protein
MRAADPTGQTSLPGGAPRKLAARGAGTCGENDRAITQGGAMRPDVPTADIFRGTLPFRSKSAQEMVMPPSRRYGSAARVAPA